MALCVVPSWKAALAAAFIGAILFGLAVVSAVANSPDACLDCHGPIEQLREATKDHRLPSGIPANPHIGFDRATPRNPHASGEGTMACTECHQPHDLPLTTPLPPADLGACMTCHHTGNFRSCADCH
jgi:hypothetical protein